MSVTCWLSEVDQNLRFKFSTGQSFTPVYNLSRSSGLSPVIYGDRGYLHPGGGVWGGICFCEVIKKWGPASCCHGNKHQILSLLTSCEMKSEKEFHPKTDQPTREDDSDLSRNKPAVQFTTTHSNYTQQQQHSRGSWVYNTTHTKRTGSDWKWSHKLQLNLESSRPEKLHFWTGEGARWTVNSFLLSFFIPSWGLWDET